MKVGTQMPTVAELTQHFEEERLSKQEDLDVPELGVVRVAPPRLHVMHALEGRDPFAWGQGVIADAFMDPAFDGIRISGLSNVAIEALAVYVAKTRGVSAEYRQSRAGRPEYRLHDAVTSAMRAPILAAWSAIRPDPFTLWSHSIENIQRTTMATFTPDMFSGLRQAVESINETTAMVVPAIRVAELGLRPVMDSYASILSSFGAGNNVLFPGLDSGIGAIVDGLTQWQRSGALTQMADFIRQDHDIDFGIRSPWLDRSDIIRARGDPFPPHRDRTSEERESEIIDLPVASPKTRWAEHEQQEVERDLRIVSDICTGIVQARIASGETVPVSEIRAATERTMRRVIVRILRKKYGDVWWVKGVPRTIREDAEQLFDKDLTARATMLRNGETLLGKTFVLGLSSIIRQKSNWADGFDAVFGSINQGIDKNRVDSWFHDFNEMRSHESHSGLMQDLHMQAATEAARKLLLPVWLFESIPPAGIPQA